jgi:hypothetical protein
MQKFETEITKRRAMSCSDTFIFKIDEQLQAFSKTNPQLNADFQHMKLTDICCAQSPSQPDDVLCFASFTNGFISQTSLKNNSNCNKAFHLQSKFAPTEVFQRAFQDADLDVSASEMLMPSYSNQKNPSKTLSKICKVTCLDFLDRRDLSDQASTLGLLLAGDALGFIYIV